MSNYIQTEASKTLSQNVDITSYFRVIDDLNVHIQKKNVNLNFNCMLLKTYIFKDIYQNSETLIWSHIIRVHNGTIQFKINNT
jgi:hypothetical protein